MQIRSMSVSQSMDVDIDHGYVSWTIIRPIIIIIINILLNGRVDECFFFMNKMVKYIISVCLLIVT